MKSVRHWHGYGPWTGTSEQLRGEASRRPGRDPADAATQAFIAATIPPMQLGHYLLRRRDTTAARTWTSVDDAMDWLGKTYAAHPPLTLADGAQAYVDLEARRRYTRDGLHHGVDAFWLYYTAGFGVVAYAVICCPHKHLTTIPCPLPPAT
jgi:hypothetical protein